MYYDRQVNLDNHPWNFQDGVAKDKIVNYIKQRSRFMVYMRSQLSFIETYGGILLRPVFTEFPAWTQAETPSTVLFGEDVLVLLNFEQDSWTRTLYSFPPEHDWVDLNTFQTYRGGVNGPYTIDTTNKVAMFQKSGSIVPLQNVTSVAEVTQKELILSIALNNSRATGYIYLEEGPD